MTRVNETKMIPLAFLCVLATTAAGACTSEYNFYPIKTDDTDTGDTTDTTDSTEPNEPLVCLAPDCPHIGCGFSYELDTAATESCFHYDPDAGTWDDDTPAQIRSRCNNPEQSTCSVDLYYESDPTNACAYHYVGDPFTDTCSYDEDGFGPTSQDRKDFEAALTNCKLVFQPYGSCDEVTGNLTWNNTCDTCDTSSRVAAPAPPPPADLKLAIDPAKSYIRFVVSDATTTFPLAGAGLVDTRGTHQLNVKATTPGGSVAGDTYTGWTLSFNHVVDLPAGGDTFRISAADRPKITGRGRRDGKPVGMWAILNHDVVGHLHPGTKRWDLDFSDAKGSTALALHFEGAMVPASGAR